MMKRNNNRGNRGLTLGITFGLILVLIFPFSIKAFAEEANKNVDKITIENTGWISDKVEQPWIYISSDGCYAEDDVEWEENFKYMRVGEIAYGNVTLRTNYGYQFDWVPEIDLKNENLSVTIEIVSDEEAQLNIEYIIQKRLSSVEFEDYNWGNRYIEWKRVSNASEYELSFFNSYNNEFYMSFTTKKTKFDLNKIKKELSREQKKEELYCEIIARSNKDYFIESEVSSSATLTLNFSINEEENYADNSQEILVQSPKCEWIQNKQGGWYYTEKSSGKNATGWQMIDGSWYYLNPNNNGKMHIGWLYLGNKYYYLLSNGKMVGNTWRNINGYWYYFYADGARAQNCWIDGYYVNSNGVWVNK